MDIFYRDNINIGTLTRIRVPEVRGPASILTFVSPEPDGLSFVTNVLITKITYAQATNTQFQESLGNAIYLYSFGDAIGTLNINGLAFPSGCDDDSNGIQELLKFYNENKVSRRTDKIDLVFADEAISGYLVSLTVSTQDTSSGIHVFTMQLKTIPDESNND